jgi:hypothetical protein
MMNSTLRKFAAPVAIASVGLAVAVPMASSAFASKAVPRATAKTYSTTLNPLNHSTGSGTFSLVLTGNQAVITEHTAGLAATFKGNPYPHVQHIHVNAKGTCPTTAADTNGDGVISTTEGQPSYGPIGTSLTLSGDTSPAAAAALTVAPSGASYDYTRTITLDSKTVDSITAGTAVIVVHGLDPATLSAKAQGEPSDLVPSLPLAATSPALCGTLVAGALPSTTPTTMPPMAPASPMPAKPTFTG